MRSQAHCRCQVCRADTHAQVALETVGGLLAFGLVFFAVWVLIASGS